MEVTIEKTDTGYLVAAKLVLKDGDQEFCMAAKYRLPMGEVLETLTDPQKTRAIASMLVGRMTTQWKLDLIVSVGDAVVEGLRAAMVGDLAETAPED